LGKRNERDRRQRQELNIVKVSLDYIVRLSKERKREGKGERKGIMRVRNERDRD
jgi:hypothetical protein